ncbi:MAG: HPP family protein [Quisquiliibacterium sp.]
MSGEHTENNSVPKNPNDPSAQTDLQAGPLQAPTEQADSDPASAERHAQLGADEQGTILEANRVPEAGPVLPFSVRHALAAWIGSFVVIGGTWELFSVQDLVFAFASLGGSTVILFSMPESRMAQPRSLFGGHAISAVVGLVIFGWFGANIGTIAAAVATALVVMQITGTTHSPAGANPIIIMSSSVSAPMVILNLGVGLLVLWLVSVVLLNGLRISPYCRDVHRQLLGGLRRAIDWLRPSPRADSSGTAPADNDKPAP